MTLPLLFPPRPEFLLVSLDRILRGSPGTTFDNLANEIDSAYLSIYYLFYPESRVEEYFPTSAPATSGLKRNHPDRWSKYEGEREWNEKERFRNPFFLKNKLPLTLAFTSYEVVQSFFHGDRFLLLPIEIRYNFRYIYIYNFPYESISRIQTTSSKILTGFPLSLRQIHDSRKERGRKAMLHEVTLSFEGMGKHDA